MIPPVLHEMLDCLPRPWKFLDFVKYDKAVPLRKVNMELGKEVHEELVKVAKVFIEVFLHLGLYDRKVNKQIRRIFTLGELLGDIALPDTSCSIEHDCRFPIAVRLPFQQGIVDFSAH